MRSWRMIIGVLAFAAAAACGGDAETETETEATAGGEDPWEEVDLGSDHEDIEVEAMEHDAPAEVATEETPTGPARIKVVNRVRGEDVSGNVQVLDQGGEVVASGRSGETFTLQPGVYRLVGEITEDEVVLGTPTKEVEDLFEVTPGQEGEAPIDFSVAHVKLRVERGGRTVGRWQIELTRRGSEEPIHLTSSDDYRNIQAGRYDGNLRFGAHRIEVSDIILQGGARGEVPIRVD